MTTSKVSPVFTSLFETAHLSCPASGAHIQAAASNQCAMNVDSVCLPQIIPSQAMSMGSNACGAPVTRLFFSASVPYSTTGQAVLPLAQARMLPGL